MFLPLCVSYLTYLSSHCLFSWSLFQCKLEKLPINLEICTNPEYSVSACTGLYHVFTVSHAPTNL